LLSSALTIRNSRDLETAKADEALPSSAHSVRLRQQAGHLLLLAGATLAALLPLSGKAFNIDDPLFMWSAQQITRHPLDPFGFQVVWDRTLTPMFEVTKNPPLACYYAALIGSSAGWSERAMHFGFLLPALAMVLGTYLLARRLTQSPLLAAVATLATPGVLVSASSVMCDTLMLALWVWGILFWMKGIDSGDKKTLLASSCLIAASALSKYFGISLVPLLFAYSLAKLRRPGIWCGFLFLPLVALLGYQVWTGALYGHGMLGEAIKFAPQRSIGNARLAPIYLLTCASFVGGCALSALMLAPLLWSWRHILLVTAGEGIFVLLALLVFGGRLSGMRMGTVLLQRWGTAGIELAIFVTIGGAILVLAAADVWTKRDAEAFLLFLWVAGTFFFTAFVNWAINGRSVLPLIPAVGILIARRLDGLGIGEFRPIRNVAAVALFISGLLSFWVAKGDADLANSAKVAARLIDQQTRDEKGAVWFEGHWGFQYYMEQQGLRPLDFEKVTLRPGDVLITPDNAAETTSLPAEFVHSSRELDIPLSEPVITERWRMAAGFYGSYFGPIPFTFGAVAPERYELQEIGSPVSPERWHLKQIALNAHQER
jgi:hypothetical protein